MNRIFVYGSLMKNCFNHDSYLHGQEFLGTAILSGYALYNLGSFPGIVPDQDGKVLGEVYEIDNSILARLDILEGNGSLYIRQPAQVRIQQEMVDAEVYVWNGEVRASMRIDFSAQPWSEKDEGGQLNE